MSIFDIFNREIKGKDGSEKMISEIIDIDRHTWQTEDGNIIMKHEGILYLRKYTGAKFLKPELQIQISNPGNVVYLCAVEFPNGEVSYEIGESNNENTKSWSKSIKPTMAFKRGFDRAFLRSDTIGLFEVYSEEESEDFKKPTYTTNFQEETIHTDSEGISNQQNNSDATQINQKQPNKSINDSFPPHATLFLPGTDKKYPGQHIIDDVLKKHKDLDYFDEILVNYPNNQDYIITIMLLKEMRERKLKKKQQETIQNQDIKETNLETTESNDDFTSNNSNNDDEQLSFLDLEEENLPEDPLNNAEAKAEAFLSGDETILENESSN